MARKTKAKKKKPPMTQAEQSAHFIEAAKIAEADERPEEFEKTLKRIAKVQFPKHNKR